MRQGRFKVLMVLFAVIAFLGAQLVVPVSTYAWNTGTIDTCQADTYGGGASGATGNPIDDGVCTLYNFATGKPGKVTALLMAVLGVIRGSGLWGNPSLMAGVVPIIFGIGLAKSTSLVKLMGYEVG